MSKAELLQVISDCCHDVVFTYNQKASGITSEVRNYVPVFQAWHGEQTKEYSSALELMADDFFGGKSLNELAELLHFTLI